MEKKELSHFDDMAYYFQDDGVSEFIVLITNSTIKDKVGLIETEFKKTDQSRTDIRDLYLGRYFLLTGMHEKAISNFQNVIESSKSQKVIIEAEIGIAYCTKMLADPVLAMEKFSMLRNKINEVDEVDAQYNILIGYARLLILNGEYEVAVDQLKLCLSIVQEKDPSNNLYQLYLYYLSGRAYDESDNVKEAKKSYERVLELANEMNSQRQDIVGTGAIAFLDIQAKSLEYFEKYSEANKIRREIIAICLEHNDLLNAMTTAGLLEKNFVKLVNIDSVYHYSQLKDSVENLINREDFVKEFTKMERDFKVKEQSQQIKLASSQLKLSESQKQNQILLGAAIILFLLLMIFLIYRRKKLQLLTKEIEMKELIMSAEKAKYELDSMNEFLQMKDRLIQELKEQIEADFDGVEDRQKLLEKLQSNLILTDDDVTQYIKQFNRIYPGFIEFIGQEFNSLSKNDKLIVSMSALGLKNKVQATILGVSARTLTMARYRLKNKLKEAREDSLTDIILEKKSEYISLNT
ncbi:MAG: tetratricopeptide repeat protein [Crocinitomicaceae bacterium]